MPKTHRSPSQGNQSPTKRRRKDVEEEKTRTPCVFIPQKSMKYVNRLSPETNENDHQSKGGGRITNIQLKNFMNHSRLDWSPIKNVNIITGPNGSGKSSILQAIVLGLGGTAKSMKRHKSVGKFVQKSQTKAEIKITICNNDNEPFKRDVYGDYIIFERHLYASGLSIYNIKNESSIVVCSGKHASIERERILDHYNILLDNPVTILHQEQAKTFFSQKDTEKNLWDFVMASTQMKSIHDEYRDSKTQLELAQSKLLDKIKHLEDGKNELRELQQQEKAFEKFQFDNKNKKYNEMIKWGYANDCEKKYKTLIKQREEKLSEIETLQNALNGWIGSLEGLNRNKQQIELKNSEIKDRAQEKEETIKNFKEEIDVLVEKKRELEIRFKEITDTQGEKRKLVQKVNSEIRTGKSVEHNDVTDQHNCNLNIELHKLEQKIEQNSNEIKRLGHGRDTIESREEKIEKEKTDVRLILKQKNNELTYRQNFLNKIENQSLRRFGENMTRLNKEIEDYSRGSCVFTKRPIGPIGRYIRLTPDAAGDDKLAPLLEVELGIGLLKSYICNCRKDRIQLEKIMQQVWSPGKEKPPIIYTRTFFDRKYNYNELSRCWVDTRNTNLTRVIDCLEVDDTIEGCNVFNLVVDQKNIEQVLITTTDQVEKLFSRIDTVPRNTKSAITREKFRYFPPSRFQNYSSYYMPQSRKLGPPLLIGDFRDEEKQNLQAIHNIEKEISDINDKYTKINNEERNLKQRSKEIIDKQLQLKQIHSNLLMEMTKIRAEIREGDENKKSTDDLIRQRDECHLEIQNLEQAKRPLLNEKDNLSKIILKLEDSMKKARGEVNRIYSESCDTSDLQRQIETVERELSRLQAQLGKLSKSLEQKTAEEVMLRQKFISAETCALKYCNNRRVDVTRDTRELDALKKEFQQQEKEFLSSVNGQSFEDINRRKCIKEKQVEKLENFVNLQQSNLNQLNNMVQKRRKFFITMRSRSMREISRDFTRQMDLHNLEGKLTPDYKMRLIDVDVRPKQPLEHSIKKLSVFTSDVKLEDSGIDHDIGGIPDVNKSSMSNLSGGERSKTLVCIINALLNVQPPPFRCLDEWDVFLDAIARKQIEGMLVNTALSSGYQYFFISPQRSMFSDIQWQDLLEKYRKNVCVYIVEK